MEHIIVDFAYLYYKYKYTIASGRIRRLSAKVAVEKEQGLVDTKEVDISHIYYPLREIEGFRREAEKRGNKVIMSICMDAPSMKKESNAEYKSNRTSKLNDDDFTNIGIISRLLAKAGHNVYKITGYEADDIVANLVRLYGDRFDRNIIYTPDTDMLTLVNDNVYVSRYKAGKGYTLIGKHNYEQVCQNEFKCNIPYNAILLYKVLCGDKSDNIKGIKGFGPAAFNNLVNELNGKVDWTMMGHVDYVKKIIESIFTGQQLKEASEALEMVGFMQLDELISPTRMSDKHLRVESYGEYNMKSLIE